MTPEEQIISEFAAEHAHCGVEVVTTELGPGLICDPLHAFFLGERIYRHRNNVATLERAFCASTES